MIVKQDRQGKSVAFMELSAGGDDNLENKEDKDRALVSVWNKEDVILAYQVIQKNALLADIRLLVLLDPASPGQKGFQRLLFPLGWTNGNPETGCRTLSLKREKHWAAGCKSLSVLSRLAGVQASSVPHCYYEDQSGLQAGRVTSSRSIYLVPEKEFQIIDSAGIIESELDSRKGADSVKICVWSSESSYFPDFAVFMLHSVELQQDEEKVMDSSLDPPLLAYLGPSSVSE
ncbi:hypothetical protein DUI87_10662 [Hirundo rustica rustica]|uniref:Uncharacterized protein n=1 Tax=Hirundo rustica rustica TaxID=333673 RepID=A0A3M0KKG1_HIRRU|nr:hypothetical protein DUI87_10662 [Hirundo rustica rustica]